MPLIDLQTDLKSLKYGSDRPGGGNSGLPYIKTDINTVDRGFNRLRLTKFDDGLVRGGFIGALNASVVDTLRIGKFLTDFPKGPLFIAKQVGLQLSNPKLEAKQSLRTNRTGIFGAVVNLANRISNEVGPTRVYNLGLNTLAQIPVNAFGGHFNRHGLLPVQNEDTKYINVVAANAGLIDSDVGTALKNNRLLGLATKFNLGSQETSKPSNSLINRARTFLGRVATTLGINIRGLKPEQLVIDEYKGGPGSVYGILGSTTINRTLQITNDVKRIKDANTWSTEYAGKTRDNSGASVSINYTSDLGKGNNAISNYNDSIPVNSNAINKATNNNVINYPTIDPNNPNLKTYAFLQTEINRQNKKAAIYSHTDYEQNKLSGKIDNLSTKYDYSNQTNYTILNKDDNYPYPKSDLEQYIDFTEQSIVNKTGSWIKSGSNSGEEIIIDKDVATVAGKNIISAPLSSFKYYGSGSRTTPNFNRSNDKKETDDTMAIVFTSINPFNLSTNSVIFLAYLNNYSETYDSGWNEVNYIGRAESFYIFNKFKRTAAIDITIPAFNRTELLANYNKLLKLNNSSDEYNGLAYSLAGQYNEQSLLGGVITRVTVGNYLKNTPGIITGLSFNIVDSSPWDLDEKLAQYIKCTFNFTVIGDYLPQNQNINITTQVNETSTDEDEARRRSRRSRSRADLKKTQTG